MAGTGITVNANDVELELSKEKRGWRAFNPQEAAAFRLTRFSKVITPSRRDQCPVSLAHANSTLKNTITYFLDMSSNKLEAGGGIEHSVNGL